MSEDAQKPNGRPPIELDPKEFYGLGKIGATFDEMAAVFGCSVDTVRRRMRDENDEFCKAYQAGLSEMKRSLRRKQIDIAEDGNVPMLIHLGKHHLGQIDKAEIKSEHTGDATVNLVIGPAIAYEAEVAADGDPET